MLKVHDQVWATHHYPFQRCPADNIAALQVACLNQIILKVRVYVDGMDPVEHSCHPAMQDLMVTDSCGGGS